ncbi:MAG: hypothetical protein A2277_14005 [Desulfobacterales bacterium RIFOXYA12_FULL_46_15]|nr:MAG: hypothetical protein A2277_14005 [Desulfobacterales bacterium RIFOXYA12_FULL_46_15]
MSKTIFLQDEFQRTRLLLKSPGIIKTEAKAFCGWRKAYPLIAVMTNYPGSEVFVPGIIKNLKNLLYGTKQPIEHKPGF